MINIKSSKAITLISLVITIIVMLIITGVTIRRASINNKSDKYNRMVSDINRLKDQVLIFYNKYGEIPKTERTITINGKEYSEIDLSKLDSITLNYGKNYGEEDLLEETSDVYAIDSNLNIYYIKGIEKEGQLYHQQ